MVYLSMVQTVMIHDLIPVDARSKSHCEITEAREKFPRRLRCTAPAHVMIFRNVMHRGEAFIMCFKENVGKGKARINNTVTVIFLLYRHIPTTVSGTCHFLRRPFRGY